MTTAPHTNTPKEKQPDKTTMNMMNSTWQYRQLLQSASQTQSGHGGGVVQFIETEGPE